MKKMDILTANAKKEEERIKAEYKKPERVGLTDKQKYLRSLRNGWR